MLLESESGHGRDTLTQVAESWRTATFYVFSIIIDKSAQPPTSSNTARQA